MTIYEKTEKAYNELIKVVKKNELYLSYKLEDIEYTKKLDLLRLELKDLGFNNYIYNYSFQDLYNGWVYFVDFNNKNYSISCSDDGRQPKNERLIKYSFSSGAYIFGEQYDRITFNEFFEELKSFRPLYSDTNNSTLYFDLKQGSKLFKVFEDIYKKYLDLSKERNKESKRQELLKQLEELN